MQGFYDERPVGSVCGFRFAFVAFRAISELQNPSEGV